MGSGDRSLEKPIQWLLYLGAYEPRPDTHIPRLLKDVLISLSLFTKDFSNYRVTVTTKQVVELFSYCT